MRDAFVRLWVRLFARPAFRRLNNFLVYVGLRGLGVLNYESMELSGEGHFLAVVLKAASAGGPEKPVVLDVGANVGNYTQQVLSQAPRAEVHCFEPHPVTVEKLRRALGSRARIVPRAVGSTEGRIELFDYAQEDGSSHASVYADVFARVHRSQAVAHQVEVISLDHYAKDTNLGHVDLLKIDTEGHELEVLRGAAQLLQACQIDAVHFEFNEMNIASRTFLGDFFDALPGFVFFRLLPRGWIPVDDKPLNNVFAFQNIVATRTGSAVHAAMMAAS